MVVNWEGWGLGAGTDDGRSERLCGGARTAEGRGAITVVSGGWVELGDLSAAVMEAEGDSGGGVGKGKG